MDKAAMRTRMKALLAGVPAADLAGRSARAAARLVAAPWWREAGTVLAFLAMPGEADPRLVVARARSEGKTAGAPLIVRGELSFRLIEGDPDALPRDAWGIPQPDLSWPAWVPSASPQPVLVVTPGLAFDAGMYRLGRGRGYYDRFLAGLRSTPGLECAAVGFCLDEQVVEAVPHDAGDQRLDAVVTDCRLLAPRG